MENMACKYREELVGKRFISVRSPVKLKIGKISEWEWRSGIVRAISSRDTSSLDLTVLIEFDDIDWTRREWIRVHDIFQLFLVEHTLVWAERPDPDKPKHSISWPGLHLNEMFRPYGQSFRAVVDKVGLSACRRKPVEFLVDRFLGLVEEKEIQIFQEGDELSHPTACLRDEVRQGLKTWLDYQDGQKILLTTPTVLVGYRLEVYRAEGTTQWYTAVIQSYNHTTKTLAVTDDTVLEEHNEDPTLIQMHLIDDGVVDSILRGVEIGITPRRRPRAVNKEKEQQNSVSKSSSTSTSQTPTVSRAPVQRKPRTPQQTPPHPPVSVTPTPEPEKTESSRSSERSTPRLRQLAPRDRKRKADTPEEPDSIESSPVSRFRKRTKSEDNKPHSPAKPSNKRDLTPSPASSVSDSTPPLRVSPRNTPSKERVLKPNQRTSTPTLRTSRPIQRTPTPKSEVRRTPTPKSEVQRASTPKSEINQPSTPKQEVQKPAALKTEVSRTPTPKSEIQKPTSPKLQEKDKKNSDKKVKAEESEVSLNTGDADLNKTKPKTRPKRETREISSDSSSVTKTQEQAAPVIKSLSGSQKDKSEKNSCVKSDKVTDKVGKLNESSGSLNVKPGKYSKGKNTTTSDNINDQVEEKLKEIRTALCEKEKEKELERTRSLAAKVNKTQTSDSVTDRKRTDKSGIDKKEKAVEKKTRKNERKKEKGKFNVDSETQGDSITEKPTNKPSKERDKTDLSDDNMHYIKKKQLSQGGFTAGQPQNSGIASSNIDINQSVTDQVTRAEKLSSLHGEEKPGSTSSTLSSPNSDTNIDRSESRDIQLPSTTQPRENKAAVSSSSSVTINTNLSWSHDERSQSRASEERCSSGLSDVGEIRRPSSQADDLKSSKSSAASSPLIVDKSEPVLPYRDPELMSKNPVRSNVPNMHNSQNSYRSERTVHNPVPTQSSRPASAGMSSTPITLSSSLSSSRTPVIPSVAYPSPIGIGHSLPGHSLSSLLPPGLHQLDPATLAIHQQMAAVQQQQISAAIVQYSGSQFQNALSLSYPGTLSSTQLEHLWQQKYPSVPVPPPWLLAKHQDDLIRDRILREQEQLERERLDRLERDRERDRAERDRVERERKERERRLEQERLEKERRERERRDREKAEQERVERERQEREKLERERHRERLERERAERSRILKESVDSHAAVDQHFSESLRLASQKSWKRQPTHGQGDYQHSSAATAAAAAVNYSTKYTRAQTGIWPPPSITLGTGKPKGDPQSLPSSYKPVEKSGEIKPEEKIKQEQLRENDYRHAEMMRMKQHDLLRQKEEYMRQHQQQMLQQHRSGATNTEHKPEVKAEPGVKTSGDMKPNMYGFPGKREPGSITTGMAKQEGGSTNFSLYGYQPEKCTFITADQLHSYGLDTKTEKPDSKSVIRSQSPRRSDMSVPPPLIKDTKPQSSVIVENKAKENLKSMSPHAHQQYAAHLHQMANTPPHGQPKPAHTPERSHERPSPSSTSPGAAYHMNPQSIAQSHMAALKSEAARQGVPGSQSPLHIASPQQLSAAVMQPMDYRCSPASNKSRSSPATTSSPHAASTSSNVSGAFTHAIAQPPVSLPQSSVAFTYSLIQQGLVPNPIYTHNSPSSKTSSDSQRTVSVTGTARVPHAAHSPHGTSVSPQQRAIPQGQKRKVVKEGVNNKRQKGPDTQGQLPAGSKALNLSVPVTTPQILTNQSPYTTSSSSTISAPSTTMAQSPMVMSQSGTPSSISSAVLSNRLSSWNSGFMDSFKSFVETTVQNAFLSDPDLAKNKIKNGQILQQIQDSQQQQQQQQQQIPQNIPQSSVPARSKSSLERSSTPVTSQQQPIQSVTTDDTSSLSNSANSSSYSETINRVANGQVDTDSDTLSAPSPPLQTKQDPTHSPHKSAKHPNLKKAWLQRHSDDHKQEIQPPAVSVTPPPMCPVHEADIDKQQLSDKEKDKDVLKNCYVNCSYISPSKEGGSKSPISAIQTVIPNGSVEKTGNIDESTTSASETETQATDGPAGSRKRVKVKKERNPAVKKVKLESEDTASNSSLSNMGQGKKNVVVKKNNDTKPKLEDDERQFEIKQELEEPGTDNSQDSSQFRSDCPSPAPRVKEEKEEPGSLEEPMDVVDAMESHRKKEKKIKKEKKDKKVKREKEVVVKEEEPEPELLPLPPPILKETELKSQQSTTFSKPLVRAPMSVLKKTCEPFIQDGSCSEVTPKLMKCRECKMTPTQKNQTIPNIFCRFYAFRRLRYSQRGFLTIDGFSELTDAEQDDIDPWIPKTPIIAPNLDIESAKFIVRRVGEKFCELVEQEKDASKSAGENAKVAWKRAVTGVREMCDVCDTTLFNMHWVCHKCGFVVCLDCYKVKAREVDGEDGENIDDTALQEEQREWLTCSANKLSHDHDKLMLTQIIPSDALWQVNATMHAMREKWSIKHNCTCAAGKIHATMKKNGIKPNLVDDAMKQASPKKKLVNGIGGEDHMKTKNKNGNIKNAVYHPDSSSPLSLLADVASMDSHGDRERSNSPFSTEKKGKHGKSYTPITEPVSPGGSGEKKMPASCSTLRELLTKTAGKGGKVKNSAESKKKSKNTNSLDDVIQTVVEKQMPKGDFEQIKTVGTATAPMKLKHYTPRRGASSVLVRDTPILIHNLTETSVLYPDVPHSWLCDGRLLRLHDPKHRGNLKIFMEQWRRGQPVLVSGADKNMNINLWTPEYFSKHFGDIENDLVNCRTGCVVVGHPMKHFWDGFGVSDERLIDEEGTPMLLKLKDWPPSDDFSDLLPKHFQDLMTALPLPEYTRRDGYLNLASRLPDFLVKPDLGPKMYIAYGSAQYPKEGTTNLHLDVSDAANVMVHVGFLEDEMTGRIEKGDEALKAIDKAGCDTITKRRVREVREVPGALWHIFDAVDADKIRDFLNKVGKERGEKIEQHHDPIHDQSWYLDEDLRDRLAKEYEVYGYTIIQCLGDTIFVPAGAPHQVRNLNNCIKVAEDFVSPEHLHHCFRMTQEFRHLSEGHSNHEDKLQVKNIIYHAVKDAVAVLNDNEVEEED